MSIASVKPSKTPNAETNTCSIRYLLIVDLLRSGGEILPHQALDA